jgi:Sec-independent protein translocase protein TatA
MLDNLGFGEVFFLGLLLFLFFGPERLPQMGARLGRWVANLTRYSGTFMEEWREEALAVHDAMEQVRGMRDEIAAARAEIAGTLHEARDDLGGAVEGARQDVGQQVQRATRFEVAEGPASAASRGTPQAPGKRASAPAVERSADAAIARTQQVIDDLRAKRAAAATLGALGAGPARATPERGSPTVPGAPGAGPARAAPERGGPTVPEERVSGKGPSTIDVARLREQVREIAAEIASLRAAVAEVREGLAAREPVAVRQGSG